MKNLPNEVNWLVLDVTLKSEWECEASRIASEVCGKKERWVKEQRISSYFIVGRTIPRRMIF